MVERKKIKLTADPKRVILRFFNPGSDKRKLNIINRVISLSEGKTEKLYNDVIAGFSDRHRNFEANLFSNYKLVEPLIPAGFVLSEQRKLLVGSYFTCEYAIESAALFNPSIVPHPDQSGLNPGELRFVMSLRGTGEGHISSIEFREGIITSKNNIEFQNESRFASTPVKREEKIKPVVNNAPEDSDDANYNISFPESVPLSERVIFPYSRTEKNGMEDVRLVRFKNEDSSSTYYGTFTAYDGSRIISQLICTNDFVNFEIRALCGEKARDKGMALFPGKIQGKYAFISRLDGENLYFMKSDNIFSWEEAELLRTPVYDWEFIQTGNCGSPLKTDDGWILITHSVGPLRRYVISALLLDKDNPGKITAALDEPLIEPEENEREGYVPNVVYSCGSIIHNGELIIPYAMSDITSGFASVSIKKLMKKFIPVTQAEVK